MNRHISRFSAGCLAIAGALALPGHATAQVGEAANQVAPDQSDAPVPAGRPIEISDWALAGVVWSDAHLVRRLADAAGSRAEDPDRRERMALLVEDCNSLINSLESFGWRRIAATQADAAVADEVVAPDVDVDVVVDEDVPVPAETYRPFNLRRYRVDGYIDRTVANPRTPADAVEDGVEEAIAAGADDVTSGFEVARSDVGRTRVEQRDVQTRSATLPYSAGTIYDVDALHPNARYPEFGPAAADDVATARNGEVVPDPVPDAADPVDLDELVEERARERRPARLAEIEVDRYTDRADRFSEDADWVKFRLAANQQRWLMLEDRADELSTEALAQHVNAAILQLRADAATAVAASDSPQLVDVLQEITE